MIMNMASFTDEWMKIAASSEVAANTKSRQGRRPIRAHNLLKKADAATAAKGAANAAAKAGFLKRHWKTLGLLGLGGAGAKGLEELVVEPMEYGIEMKRARGEF
jgi:hypothetical protein